MRTRRITRHPPQEKKPKQDEDQENLNQLVNTNATHCIVSLPIERGAQATSAESRNPTETTGSGVVYGLVTNLDNQEPNPPNPPPTDRVAVAISQRMIDRADIERKIYRTDQLVEAMIADGQTVSRRVLTYFSENNLYSRDILDNDSDQAQDPSTTTGEWVGIARLYMTPLTLGYDRVQKLGQGTKFSAESPMQVRLVSATFSVKSVQIEKGTQSWPYDYIGPVRSSLHGFPCSVAFIPAKNMTLPVGDETDNTEKKQRVQDAGDSFLVKKLNFKNTATNQSYYFCGIGLTTRNREGYEDAGDQPLYEAGMQDVSGAWHPSTSVVITSEKATHRLNLTAVSKKAGTQDQFSNTYTITKIDPGEEGLWTKEKVLAFQEKQTIAGTKNENIPLWGAVQVQVPKAALRGLVLDAIPSGTSIASFVSAVMNINLVFAVDVSHT